MQQGVPFLNLPPFCLNVGKQLIYLLFFYSQHELFQPLSLFIIGFFDILEKGKVVILQADLEFVKKFTGPNFRVKEFYTLKKQTETIFASIKQ